MAIDPAQLGARIRDPQRLAALARLRLVGTPREEAFDRLARLATRLLGTPGALVNLVTDEVQFCKSSLGLPEPWASRGLPLDYGLCPYAVASGEPLIVGDAGADPGFRDNPGVRALGVAGYAGIPLLTNDGHAIGAFCAFDTRAREWTAEDVQTLKDLAAAVMTEIELRAAEAGGREREAALVKRTRQAELGAAVGAALAGGETLRDQLQRCAQAMVDHLDAAFARIWTLATETDVLDLQASAGCYTHLDGAHGRVAVGHLKIGRIAAARRPHLTNDVLRDPHISDHAWAAREGMVAFAGYPLIVDNRLVGVMALFARQPLTVDTLTALAAVADAVATGIERKRAEAALAERERQLREERETLETVNRVGRMLTAELDLDDLVQAVTDAATTLAGAQFGAFFSNAIDERGEFYTLYAITGVPRSAFAPFPLPRNTPLFGPTFRGEGIVRLADVRLDPHFGHNAPHHGLPPGHLPVVSYLAVPVVGRSGEVLGGLFFGHPEPGIFDQRAERLTAGLAAQAAIAIENARLYRQAQQELAERRRAEEEKQAFLDAVAHDLQNPLGAVSAQAQLMRRRLRRGVAEPASLDTGLAAIEAAVRRSTRLIGELLDVAHLEAGRPLDLNRTSTDLVALAREVVAERQASSSRHAVRFEQTLPALDGEWDADRLARVLENLLSNAIRYSPDGGAILVRAVREDDADGAWGVLVVADRGVGIPADDLPHIFTRFHRGRNVAGRIAGTGIGLWGAERIVAQHGGTIAIDSREGEGTTVTVRLPLGPDHVARLAAAAGDI